MQSSETNTLPLTHILLFLRQVLCALANGLKPGSIPDVSKGSNAFIQMQNIDKFLKTCRNVFKVIVVTDVALVVLITGLLAVVLMMVIALQVPEYELFETVDLFEEKDMTVILVQQ